MPKAIRFHALGGPENLKLEEAAARKPGAGEVALRVLAVGLNRAESMYYHGHYFERPVLPSRLGYEAAGVVEAVGDGVDGSWLGKTVATVPGYSQNKYGVLAEEAIVPAEVLAEYPANLTPVEGAAVWMQYVTAYGALVHFGGVTHGDFVLIPAASSSVGLAAIQLVKANGGIAIATTRGSRKKSELAALGADHVIVTDEEDLAARVKEITGGKGARLIFDPVGGPFVEKLAEVAAYHGTIFEYGMLSMQPTPFPSGACLSKGLSVRGYTLHELIADAGAFAEAKRFIFDGLASGLLKPKIAKSFPIEETVQAYQYLESNAQIGKVVITVQS